MKSNNKWWGLFGKRKEIRDLKEKLEQQKEEIEQLKEDYKKEVSMSANKSWQLLCDLDKTRDEKNAATKKLNELEQKYKEEKENLKAEIEDLNKQLKESMSDKFRVKKIPAGRTPKGDKIKLKNSSKQSKIIKKVKAN